MGGTSAIPPQRSTGSVPGRGGLTFLPSVYKQFRWIDEFSKLGDPSLPNIDQALAGVSAMELSARDIPYVAAEASVAAIQVATPRAKWQVACCVMRGGRPVGLLAWDEIDKIAPEQRAVLTAADVMIGAEQLPTAAPDESGLSLIQRTLAENARWFAVVANGAVQGFVTRDSMVHFTMERVGWLNFVAQVSAGQPALAPQPRKRRPLRGTFSVGRIRQVPVRVHWSLSLMLLFAGSFVPYDLMLHIDPDLGGWPYWLWGLAAVFAFVLCSALYGLAQAVACRRLGLRLKQINLTFCGWQNELEAEPPSARVEFFGVGAGIALIAGAGAAFFIPGLPLDRIDSPVLTLVLYLTYYAAFIFLFCRLMPGASWDTVLLVRSLLWWATRSFDRATRITAKIAQALGWAMTSTVLTIPLPAFGVPFQPNPFFVLPVAIMGAMLAGKGNILLRDGNSVGSVGGEADTATAGSQPAVPRAAVVVGGR